MTDHKICSHCGVEQPLDSYSPHKLTADRRQSWCRKCRRDAQRERRARSPEMRERERVAALLYDRALAALRERHRTEFDEIHETLRGTRD